MQDDEAPLGREDRAGLGLWVEDLSARITFRGPQLARQLPFPDERVRILDCAKHPPPIAVEHEDLHFLSQRVLSNEGPVPLEDVDRGRARAPPDPRTQPQYIPKMKESFENIPV